MPFQSKSLTTDECFESQTCREEIKVAVTQEIEFKNRNKSKVTAYFGNSALIRLWHKDKNSQLFNGMLL